MTTNNSITTVTVDPCENMDKEEIVSDSGRQGLTASVNLEDATLNKILRCSNVTNVDAQSGINGLANGENLNGGRREVIDNPEKKNLNIVMMKYSANASLTNSPVPTTRSKFREIHDLTKLECITLKNVLECLKERYRSQQYYTYAGPVLLSLNSCQRVSRLSVVEDVTRMRWYFTHDEKHQESENDNTSKGTSKTPHVFDIGLLCLKNLVTVGSHQIILVSGESGAGKTTATQQLIKYLTENNSRNFGANTCSNLDKKIYFATLILEAFGNAKTQANPNSSRFGRLVLLNYKKGTGQIAGAEIQTYLLEKHRVAKFDFRCERSFHIFYYILHGLKTGLGAFSSSSINWDKLKDLVPEHLGAEALQSEDEEIGRLQTAVQAFNMNCFSEIVNILLAIITLLKATFVPDYDSSSEDEYSSSLESPYKTEFTISDWKIAKVAADLLGVSSPDLVDILIARKITAGGIHRHSIFRKPCERIPECEERLHALTSFIYDRIFTFVLDHLNMNLKGDSDMDFEDHTTLSLLDLYGFENFNVNHLEQICINYANERLQQINVSIIKSHYEQSIPPDEVMIPPTELIRIENELHQRIDELHGHIFSFFDEECLLKRASQDRDVLERMSMSLANRKSKFIKPGRPHEPDCRFTVTHYATTVDYRLNGIVQKNKDHIPPEFQDLLKFSTNSFISNLFQQDLIRSRNASGATSTPKSKSHFTVSNNKNTRGKTILTRFKQSVEDLMSRLKMAENKDVHFIRCIRPNADLTAGTFSMSIVEKQLHACGISDVVKIAGNGFPIRINATKFSKEFPKVITYFCRGHLDHRILLTIFERKNEAHLKFGKSLVFLSEKCWKSIKSTEKLITVQSTKVIQRRWRKYLEQQEILKMTQLHDITPVPTVSSSADDDSETETPIATDTDARESMDSLGPLPNFRIGRLSQRFSKGFRPQRQLPALEQQLIENRRPPLYFGPSIASRTPVHTLPIKLYTKKTCLRFGNSQPRRLIANGLMDAFEDFGIVFERQ